MKKALKVSGVVILIALYLLVTFLYFSPLLRTTHLLLAEAGVLPANRDFSRYGFTFRIPGKITLVSNERENLLGYCEFETIYGRFYVTKMEKLPANSIEEGMEHMGWSKEILENGARVYINKVNHGLKYEEDFIDTDCFIDHGDYVWKLFFMTPESEYDADKILDVCKSFKLVDPS